MFLQSSLRFNARFTVEKSFFPTHNQRKKNYLQEVHHKFITLIYIYIFKSTPCPKRGQIKIYQALVSLQYQINFHV